MYTCPADETALIKAASVYASGASGTFYLEQEVGSSGLFIAVDQRAVSSGNSVYWQLWLVLHPGDHLYGNSTWNRNACYPSVYGAELEGVAD